MTTKRKISCVIRAFVEFRQFLRLRTIIFDSKKYRKSVMEQIYKNAVIRNYPADFFDRFISFTKTISNQFFISCFIFSPSKGKLNIFLRNVVSVRRYEQYIWLAKHWFNPKNLCAHEKHRSQRILLAVEKRQRYPSFLRKGKT